MRSLGTLGPPGRLALVASLALSGSPLAAQTAFQTIHVFSSPADGNSPRAALVLAPSGDAYGATLLGGSSNNGTVYQLTPVSGTEKWTESVIYSFAGAPDGANPAGALIAGPDGVLYGTTIAGGGGGAGTVFQLTPPTETGGAWTESILYSFGGVPDGAAPHAGVVLGSNGLLYGTTAYGGTGTCASGCGTVFSLAPPAAPGGVWTETVLRSFQSSDGANPYASLAAESSSFLGTTVNGGEYNSGVIFSVTESGVLKVLHSFEASVDGANPYAPLSLDTKGNVYGTARNGGTSGFGTLFTVTKGGALSILHTFSGVTDGANPVAGVLAIGSALYGAASLGGSNGDGTLFLLELPTSTFKVLHTFNGANQSANPLATPILAPSAALLGTCEPMLILDGPRPQTTDAGSDFSFCTKNPPVCGN